MVKPLKFWTIVFALLLSNRSQAQITWNKIIPPDTINKFAIGTDGSLYVSTGWFRPTHDLYFSSDRGAQWMKIDSENVRILACDSNGAVIVGKDKGLLYSVDHGTNWVEFSSFPGDVSGRGGLECTRNAIYFIPGYDNKLYRNSDYDSSWNSVSVPSGEIDDLTGPYCGTPDRVLVGENFESSWVLLDSLEARSDMRCKNNGPYTDNSPPRLITYGRDGYLYLYSFGYMRLPPGSLQWDCYDPWDTAWSSRTHHFPYSSLSSTALLSIDTGGTWASSNHGTSWTRLGNAPPMSSLWQLTVESKGHVYAHTDSGLFETDFFANVKQKSDDQFSLSIAPNPCGASLTIMSKNIGMIEILDALGRTRMQYQFKGLQDNPSINLETLPPGAYFVLVERKGLREMAAFVKQ